MHRAIYVLNHENKAELLKQIQAGDLLPLAGQRVAVYSKLELLKFLRKEHQYEHYALTEAGDQTLASLSEGEQKKALLQHLLKQPIDVLVVDDVFDSLDVQSQKNLEQQLKTLSQSVQIIQLFSRSRDLLSFIARCLQWREGKLCAYQQAAELALDSVMQVPPSLSAPVKLADPLIELNQVSISFYDKPVLQAMDWQINKGDFWQLLGPNGSGKSSLLKLITGDSPKAYGQSVKLFGYQKGSGESVWDIKQYIGYFTSSITQNFSRYQTVESMLLSGFFDSVGLYQKPSKQQQALTQQWLELIGLEALAKKPFDKLSLGHQRLLLVARAMVKHPPLLILDEPSAGLDDVDINRLVALVNAMAKNKQAAIIYVSHRQEHGLQADKLLQLTPSANGSVARIESVSTADL